MDSQRLAPGREIDGKVGGGRDGCRLVAHYDDGSRADAIVWNFYLVVWQLLRSRAQLQRRGLRGHGITCVLHLNYRAGFPFRANARHAAPHGTWT